MDVSRNVPARRPCSACGWAGIVVGAPRPSTVLELRQRYIARLDRDAIRWAVERHPLLVRRDSVLFELQATFGV